MLILISDHELFLRESEEINGLFESGLELFHVRHANLTDQDFCALIEGVEEKYRHRLVAHHNHSAARKMGIHRFHFTEDSRADWEKKKWKGRKEGEIYSTSVHSVESYNELPEFFSYCFISPVFDSISKMTKVAVEFELSKRKPGHPVKMIGLGGIYAGNVDKAIKMGFDGVAVLGSIWNSEEPVKAFLRIKRNYQDTMED